MAKNKLLRFTTAIAVIFTAVLVSKKSNCPKNEKEELNTK